MHLSDSISKRHIQKGQRHADRSRDTEERKLPSQQFRRRLGSARSRFEEITGAPIPKDLANLTRWFETTTKRPSAGA
jgi:hypothetical protein